MINYFKKFLLNKLMPLNILKFVSNVINVEESNLLYACFILSTYPIGLFYRKYISHEFLKHVFSIFVGTIFSYSLFSLNEVLYIIGISSFTWCVVLFVPIKYRPHMIVFGTSMAQLSALHIYYMMKNWMIWKVEVTGVMMLLTIKMTSFAFDHYDTQLKKIIISDKEIIINDKETKDINDKDKEIDSHNDFMERIEERERKNPSILEWFGYVFFFPSFLTGPTLSFNEYMDCIQNPVQPDDINCAREHRQNAFLTSFFFLALHMIGAKFFPVKYLGKTRFPFIYAFISMFLLKCKYYFGWTFAKSTSMASGVSEDVSNNVNVLKVELGQNAREVLTNWNICSSKWLKKYIYSRMISCGWSSSMSTFSTNVVSAFWHGFYPGYYLTFLTGGMITEIGKHIRRKVRPYFKNETGQKLSLIYDVTCTLNMMILVTYAAFPFQLYGFYESFNAWRELYFIGHIMLIIGIMIVCVFPKRQKCD